MAKTNVLDPAALKTAVDKYFCEFPGDLICALQLWYEGLGGQGVPNAAEMTAVQNAIANLPGWKILYSTLIILKRCVLVNCSNWRGLMEL